MWHHRGRAMASGCLAVFGMGDSGLWYCGVLGWGLLWGTGRALLPLEWVLWGQNTLLRCQGSYRLRVLLCWQPGVPAESL